MTNNRNNVFNNRTTIYYDDSSDNYCRSNKRRADRHFDDEHTRNLPRLRHTEEARAITRAKGRKQNILLSAAAIMLVALIAVGAMAMGGVFNTKGADSASTSVSSQTDKGANKAAPSGKQTTQQTETKQDDTAVQFSQDDNQQADVQTPAQISQDDQQTSQDNQQTDVQSADDQSQSDSSSSQAIDNNDPNIEIVNGERIYRDTKRLPPANTGTAADYYANGKTSYGFDWDYDTDNSNFVLACDYNFDQQQYMFHFYGAEPGTAHVTLYYYTSDSNKIPVSLTVTVDDNLNASVS